LWAADCLSALPRDADAVLTGLVFAAMCDVAAVAAVAAVGLRLLERDGLLVMRDELTTICYADVVDQLSLFTAVP
jgi:hypothetical protein